MGPKPQAAKPKGGSSFKALDDFLEKSSAVPGQEISTKDKEQLDAQNKAIREKYFEVYSLPALQQNLQTLEKCRTQTLIFGGIAAGIFGLDGMQGMLFYLFLVAFVSLIVGLRLGFNPQPYFVKLSQAITTGLFSNLLTYMLMWVMFHNLVYVL